MIYICQEGSHIALHNGINLCAGITTPDISQDCIYLFQMHHIELSQTARDRAIHPDLFSASYFQQMSFKLIKELLISIEVYYFALTNITSHPIPTTTIL